MGKIEIMRSESKMMACLAENLLFFFQRREDDNIVGICV